MHKLEYAYWCFELFITLQSAAHLIVLGFETTSTMTMFFIQFQPVVQPSFFKCINHSEVSFKSTHCLMMCLMGFSISFALMSEWLEGQ